MDDDSPDDVALRTFARQLFGDHGLGRDTAGERATVRSITRRRHPRVLRRALPHRRHDGRRRRRRRPRRGRRRGRARRSPAMPAGDGRVAAVAPGRGRGRRRHRRRLRAGAPRRSAAARCRATIPTARRSTSSTTSSAAACRAACSTRSASAAGSPTACTRRRRRTPTPARGRCTPASMPEHAGEVAPADRQRARPARRRRHHRRRAGRSPSATSPAPTRWASRTPAPACRGSAGCSPRSATCIPVDEQIARWEAVTHADVRRVIDRVYGAGRPRDRVASARYDR